MVVTKGFFTGGEGGFYSPMTTDKNDKRDKKEEKKSRLAQVRGGDPTAVSSDVSDDIEGFNKYLRTYYDTDMDDKRYKNFGGQLKRILKESYIDDKNKGQLRYQEGNLINRADPQEGNILQKTGTFLANIFSSPAVAGTLEGKPTRFAGQVSPTVSKQTDTRSSVTTSSSGINRSQSRRSGRSTSSSRGGVSRGSSKSNTGSKSTSRGASGSAGSRSRGGTGPGRTSTSRTASKASRSRTGRSRSQCDIRTKIDINPLTNNNLIRDDLANIAYFVREIK